VAQAAAIFQISVLRRAQLGQQGQPGQRTDPRVFTLTAPPASSGIPGTANGHTGGAIDHADSPL
jgi:hypothetical protein